MLGAINTAENHFIHHLYSQVGWAAAMRASRLEACFANLFEITDGESAHKRTRASLRAEKRNGHQSTLIPPSQSRRLNAGFEIGDGPFYQSQEHLGM